MRYIFRKVLFSSLGLYVARLTIFSKFETYSELLLYHCAFFFTADYREHCFWNNAEKKRPRKYISVGLEKIKRNYFGS